MGKGGMLSVRKRNKRFYAKKSKNHKSYCMLFPEILFQVKDKIMKDLS